MKLILALVLGVSLSFSSALYNRGEYLYFAKACSSCHGPEAKGSSTAPKLAHKKQGYLFERLLKFKRGEVYTQNQEMMAQFVQALTKEDLKAISVFLSQIKQKEYPDVEDDLLGGFGS